MRQGLPPRLLFSSRCIRSRRSYLHASNFHAVRSITTSPTQLLAQVRSDRDGFPELWFSSSSPYLCSEKPNAHLEETGNDERTLKLGKSKPPGQFPSTLIDCQEVYLTFL